MAINIQISDKKNRYGYITNNDRVHDVVQQNLEDSSYGAASQGDIGLARHNNLKSMFSKHPNAISADSDESIIVRSMLAGRPMLQNSNPTAEAYKESSIQRLKSLETEIEARIAEEAARAEEVNAGSGQAISDTAEAGNASEDSQLKDIRSKIKDLEDIDSSNDDNVFEEIGALGISAFNPDFDNGTVSFNYTNLQAANNRSKDGVTSASRAPNIAVPSKANAMYVNPETAFVVDEVSSGYNGGGGFGPTASTNHTTTQTNEILSRYTDE
jgi:hypothetical protein